MRRWCMPTLLLAVRALGRTRRFHVSVSVLCTCVELRMCAHLTSRLVVNIQLSCVYLLGFMSELRWSAVV